MNEHWPAAVPASQRVPFPLPLSMGGSRPSGSPLPHRGVLTIDARRELGCEDCYLRGRTERRRPPSSGYARAFLQVANAGARGRVRGTIARACGGQAPGAPLRTSPSRCRAVGWATRVGRPAGDQLLLPFQRSTGCVGFVLRSIGPADAGRSSGSAA